MIVNVLAKKQIQEMIDKSVYTHSAEFIKLLKHLKDRIETLEKLCNLQVNKIIELEILYHHIEDDLCVKLMMAENKKLLKD